MITNLNIIIMELKYGDLYKCENDEYVIAHDTFSTNGKMVKISRFIQEHENELQKYLDSFIDNNGLVIVWIDKSGKKRSDDYKLIIDPPYI